MHNICNDQTCIMFIVYYICYDFSNLDHCVAVAATLKNELLCSWSIHTTYGFGWLEHNEPAKSKSPSASSFAVAAM